MPKLDCPLQLYPVFKPKIWGRRDLAPLFPFPRSAGDQNVDGESPSGSTALAGKGSTSLPERAARARASEGSDDLKNIEPIGEVWITDDAARFLNGPVAGLTLAQAAQEYGPELLGACWKSSRFPILAKYIYTSDWLSVQVHPDDAYARVHEPGNVGKCEMWYVIRADRGGEILLGLKQGVTKDSLKSGFEKGRSRELLRRFHPKSREAIFVPPGTVHALGPGLVLFEAEENCDLTYRLDDFGRIGRDGKPRPLHWAKGLDVIRTDLPPHRNLPPLNFREPFGTRRYVLACSYFAVEELALRKTGSFEGRRERVEVYSVLEGGGRVETAAGWLAYRAGDTWIIPPATGRYRLVPERKSCLLKFYVPDLDGDFRRPLARRGVRAAPIKKIVFD